MPRAGALRISALSPGLDQFDRLHVVLVGTRNPLNIGAAARAMSNFGFSSLRLVQPYAAAFREARSAVGGSGVLAAAEEHKTVADAIADCTLVVGTTAVRHRNLHHPLHRLERGARLIRKRLGSSCAALLFGSEKFGLTNEALSHCHWLMRIPTAEQNISMNVGQAVAVCLYELVREPKPPAPAESIALASAEEVERITQTLLEALDLSGFLDRRHVADADERIRRVVRRLRLPASDVKVWLGMLRQILWKLRQPESRD
jgi:TrmH family RNA methyltransferase